MTFYKKYPNDSLDDTNEYIGKSIINLDSLHFFNINRKMWIEPILKMYYGEY
jgi:hypothetical protein